MGYRGQSASGVTLSTTAYQADCARLRTQESDSSFTYVYYANGMESRVSGFEAWGGWQATPIWRPHAGFSRLIANLRLRPGGNDTFALPVTKGNHAAWCWTLRSATDLGDAVELDALVRQFAEPPGRDVPRYANLELRLGWRRSPGVKLSVAGRKLLGLGYAELSDRATRSHWSRRWRVAID